MLLNTFVFCIYGLKETAKNPIKKNVKFNEPLTLGSNEGSNNVAILAGGRFTMLFYVLFAFLAYRGRASFAVIGMENVI